MVFDDKNIDENRNGDFESFEKDTLLNQEDWQCNDTYYIKDKLENSIIEEDGKAEASCHFCNKKYVACNYADVRKPLHRA